MAPVDMATFIDLQAVMQPGDLPEFTLEEFAAPRPAWQAKGACRSDGTAAYFVGPGGDQSAGKARCAGCPVKGPCLAYALADLSIRGIWGGTSDRERQALRRAQVAA